MSEAVKVVNYPAEVVEAMVKEYEANPTRETVNKIAKDLNKEPRSVIAKLSTLGVYVVPAKTTKAGEPIVKKEDIVADISKALGVDMPSLVKANKADLNKLIERVAVVATEVTSE